MQIKLEADAARHGVMMTEPISNLSGNAQKVGASMFETFNVRPALSPSLSPWHSNKQDF